MTRRLVFGSWRQSTSEPSSTLCFAVQPIDRQADFLREDELRREPARHRQASINLAEPD